MIIFGMVVRGAKCGATKVLCGAQGSMKGNMRSLIAVEVVCGSLPINCPYLLLFQMQRLNCICRIVLTSWIPTELEKKIS